MTRTLTLAPGDTTRFVLLWNAFHLGGDQVYAAQRGQRPAAERRKEAQITRALKGISIITNEQTGARELKLEGGQLVIDQQAFLVLEKYVQEAPLSTSASDELEALLDWISAAEKQETPT